MRKKRSLSPKLNPIQGMSAEPSLPPATEASTNSGKSVVVFDACCGSGKTSIHHLAVLFRLAKRASGKRGQRVNEAHK